jgi:hypothetical protein
MKLTLSIIIYLLIISNTFAQSGIKIVSGAKGAAMANAAVTFQDVFSITSNQAGIAFLEKPNVGLLAEQRFLSADIRQFGAVAAMPTKFGSFGLLIQTFGFEVYQEQKIGLSYARKLSKKFAIGVQFDYFNTRISEYGSFSAVSFEVGLQAEILKNLWLGAAVSNPFRIEIAPDEYLPTQFNFGLSYRFSDKIFLATEVQKDFEYPTSVKVGLDYHIIEPLSIRLGVGTEPVQNSFGVGIHLKQFTLDFAARYHQILGFTPTFSMTYVFEKSDSNSK